MQFDEFDKKITDAANHHHPAYDEQAWTKMEKLLNKHLPQEKDDRRGLLILFLVLLALGGLIYFVIRPGKTNKPVAETKSVATPAKETMPLATTTTQLPAGNNEEAIAENKPNTTDETNTTSPVLTNNKEELTNQPIFTTGKTRIVKKGSPENNSNWIKDNNINKVLETVANTNDKSTIKTDNKIYTPLASNIPRDNDDSLTMSAPETKGHGVLMPGYTDEVVKKTTPRVDEPVASTNQTTSTQSTTDQKKKTAKKNSFFLSLSAGPDISFVGSNKLGSAKLTAGAGIGYTIKDRVTIRTGFYSGRKIYTASPDAYHPPAIFYSYYPYLEEVSADCKVYEVPVTVSYRFKQTAKQSFFASAGVSSYIMKKEKYDYSYKYNPNGPLYTQSYTIKNENKHSFSGLTLSAGYERKLGKHISLMAEPYIQLPVKGIGYGKVKLNSGGVLFTVAVKPFK